MVNYCPNCGWRVRRQTLKGSGTDTHPGKARLAAVPNGPRAGERGALKKTGTATSCICSSMKPLLVAEPVPFFSSLGWARRLNDGCAMLRHSLRAWQ